MKMNIWIVLGSVLIAVGAAFAPLSMVSPSLLDDTTAMEDKVNASGADEKLYVRSDMTAIVYVKFDVNFTSNITINSATLSLTQTDYDPSIDTPLYICTHRVLEDWDEYTLTWENKPSYDEPESCTLSDSVTVSFDVKDIVRDWVSEYENFGIALDSTRGATQSIFHSKESTHPEAVVPTLEIDWTDPDGDDHDTIIDDDGIDDTVDPPTDDTDSSSSYKSGLTTESDVPDWAWWILILGAIFLIFGLYKSRKGR